jgi:hypothetical protein
MIEEANYDNDQRIVRAEIPTRLTSGICPSGAEARDHCSSSSELSSCKAGVCVTRECAIACHRSADGGFLINVVALETVGAQ